MAVGLTVDSPAGVVSVPPGVKQAAKGRWDVSRVGTGELLCRCTHLGGARQC